MKKVITSTLLCLPFWAAANDSIGFVSTGGIEYIKNDKIAMQNEDLFISQSKVEVAYQYKNLTDKDITETVLFPLPPVFNQSYSDFADTQGLVESFKIYADGRSVKPQVYVRAFLNKGKDGDERAAHDVTEIFKACGLSDEEMMSPWTQKSGDKATEKILKCTDSRLAQFNLPKTENDLFWQAQIVYGWQQTFKANEITEVKHEYRPLVGGSVSMPHPKGEHFDEFGKIYCTDQQFKKTLIKHWQENGLSYSELGYILTSGANWAKPIGDFTLTVERDKNQLVSFCWDGKGELKKIKDDGNVVQFQVKEKNFLPQRDLNLLFVKL